MLLEVKLLSFKKYYLAWGLIIAFMLKMGGLLAVYFLFFQGKKVFVDASVISKIFF